MVQRAAQQPYESYVRQQVLRPLGVGDMRLEQLSPAYAAPRPTATVPTGGNCRAAEREIAAPAGNWLANVVDPRPIYCPGP